MKLCSSDTMRALDRYAIDTLKIPSTLLMEAAAGHVADAAEALLPPGGQCAVLCGSGNNGGDGVAAAGILRGRGARVRAFLVGPREKMTPDTREMERRLIAAGGTLEPFGAEIKDYVNSCDVIIDAIFGIGLNTEIRGDALFAVEMMNESPGRVVSADIPSGVSADTGQIWGRAAEADITVTFSAGKPGLYVTPGCLYAGAVRVCDIGIPRGLLEAAAANVFAVTGEAISLPPRRLDSHKGDYGRVLILAGSPGYTGAPVLAAHAASRMGAGLVFLGVPEEIYPIVAGKCDVEMPFPLEEEDGGYSASAALARAGRASSILVGPGLGRSDAAAALVREILRRSDVPIVLDADGINAAAANIDVLSEAACPLILTPHEGEFARLGGDVAGDGRLRAASEFAKKRQCVLILKGYRTITAFPDGTAYVNLGGGPGLAKGGTGDVLAGMVTALLGQGFPVKDACLAAVWLHGLAGDLCTERLGAYSVTANDVIAALPEAVRRHTEN